MADIGVGFGDAIELLNTANHLHYEILMVYVVVALGLLGFRFSASYEYISKKNSWIVVIGFCIFAVSNLIAMQENISQYNTILFYLKNSTFSEYSIDFKFIFSSFCLKNCWRILSFQVISALIMIYMLRKQSL